MARWVGSSTPIDAGETETIGGEIQPEGADHLVGLVFTDQAGSLLIDQSADGGRNWDFTTTVAVVANTGKEFSVPIYGNRVRVRFNNTAGTNQTAFRLNARMSSTGPRS